VTQGTDIVEIKSLHPEGGAKKKIAYCARSGLTEQLIRDMLKVSA